MEITQVYSTRRSIRYSSRGRGRVLSFPLVPGLETVDSCLLPPAPKKKTRTLYSTDQLDHLEALFQEDHYPDAEKRKVIAASVGVTPQRIMVWFQNRRAKWRKVERSITARVEHRPSRGGCSSPPQYQINPTLPTLAPNSKGAPCFSNHFATKLPQLAPAAPSFPNLFNQTPPSYSNLLASLNSPGQSRARDVGQHQLSSQGGLAEYHPRPMHSPPPLRRASLPLFTTTYNPANPTPPPPLLNTLAHTPPLFLDALEGGSALAHRDTQSLQTDTSSLFDFGEKLDYLTSGQQNNPLPYQLQTSYSSSQPQHQTQAPLPRMAYLTPSPYLTPNPPDSNPTSYLTFGPGGNSTGMVTYSTGGHAYFQSQNTGQILLQSAGHHGGITAYQSYPWGSMYSQPAIHQRTQCPPTYPGSLEGARDHQPPSSTTLPPSSFFTRGDHGSSHANSQCLSHTHTHTSSSSSTVVLPPVSTLRPSCLRAEITPTKAASLLSSQSADTLRPPRHPSVAGTMTPTPPLFLLLLGLIGAHATVDLRTAAAMAAGLCKTRPTDIVFIIDSSRSVRPSEFEQVKVFLAKVIEGLDVGPNATRVGVVNYASRVKNEVSLKTHRTKAGLIKAVTKIEPLSTGTMTGLSIQFAMNVAFSEAEGARVKSPDISKVAIIVTDGRPQDSVKDVAQRARDAGIEIFAIGVGRVDIGTLKQMASDPLDDHVDYVESYSVIEKLTKKFQEAFCVSDLCATGDHDCEQVCISSPGSFKCACKDGFTLMDNGRSCSACSNSATDVVFLIDGSKSVRPENFELVKKWINQIVDKLDVSDSKAHVGLVQYSSSVRQEFPLGRYNNKKDLKDAVKKMAYMERGTMTGQALRYLTDNSFSAGQGARPGVAKVGIVFTDGRSQDYIGEAAKKAKEHGFKMYAVGVGNAVEDELKEIASEPTGEHYFYTADFKAMTQIAKKLQINICQEEDPCECDSLVKFQKKVEEALQALTKKLDSMSKRIALLENKIV